MRDRLQERQEFDHGMPDDGRVQLGNLTIDLESRTVCRKDASVPLQEKPFLLLRSLLRHPGRIVTREELIEELWPPGLHVDFDHGLNTAVKKLRQALDDSAREPHHVETVPRRGYRLLSEALPIAADDDSRPAIERPTPEERAAPAGRRAWLLLGWTAAAALLGLATLAALRTPWLEQTAEPQTAAESPRPAAIAEPGISLAVMPLRNLNASPEGEYFVEGLTEEIITALGALAPASVRLIASSSTVRFRDSDLPADVIGSSLGADYLVTGSLRRDHDRSRISLQVVRAATREQRWSASYEFSGEDVLTIQSRIASNLIQAVPHALWRPPLAAPGKPPTTSTAAYDTYLKGIYFHNKQTPEGALRATEYLEQAIEIDPDFAAALSTLGKSWLVAMAYGARPTADELETIRRNAARAIEIAPESALGHMVQGSFELIFERDWQAAEASIHRALDLDPGYSAAHEIWAWWLLARGRHREALVTMELVRELDPLSPRVLNNLGWFRYYAGHYAEAIAPCTKAIELEPKIAEAAECLQRAHFRLGLYAEASELLSKTSSGLGLGEPATSGTSEAGYRAQARRLLDELLKRDYGLVRPFDTAARHALVGDTEGAVAWLEKAEQIGDPELLLLLSTPDLAGLRSDPRIAALAQRLGLSGPA